MPKTIPLTFTADDVSALVKVASRLANAQYLHVNLLDEATVIMRMIERAKQNFTLEHSDGHLPVNPFDAASEHLLDQPQVRKLHDMPNKIMVWEDIADDEQKRFEASKARRENAKLKQQAIDARLKNIGIGAGAVGTWRDIRWLEALADMNPGKPSGWLLNKLADYTDAMDSSSAKNKR